MVNSIVEKRIRLNKTDTMLVRIHKEYDDNFKDLVSSVGTEFHPLFLSREQELQSQCIRRQKELGILIPNPKMDKNKCWVD